MKIRNIRIVIILVYAASFFALLDLCIGHFYIKKLHRQYYHDTVVEELANSNRVSDSMYHHGFVPNTSVTYHWYNDASYPLYVNSLGLVDENIRVVPKTTDKYRIVFFGDSYTEGVGYSYDKTFVGITAKTLGDRYDVLNAGVQRYSPKLYLQKAKFLLGTEGVKIHEAVIFLDLSDIIDEFYTYRDFQPTAQSDSGSAPIRSVEHTFLENLRGFFIDNSVTVNFLYTVFVKNPEVKKQLDTHPYEWIGESWTYDDSRYQLYGKGGLELCRQYMSELVAYLKMQQVANILLVVYPWQQQILHEDMNSRHVRFWDEFAAAEHIRFLNLFPIFFERQKSENLYIIDDHFNERGHQLVADSVVPLVASESAQVAQ